MAAVLAMTPACHVVLAEVYLKGRAVAEAAVVLGLPVGTVKSRTFSAFAQLRELLAEQGIQA